MNTHPKTTDPRRGYWIAFLSAAILSTTAVFIRYLTDRFHMPALVLAFWRDLFAVSVLLPVLALSRSGLLRVNGERLWYLAVYGLVLAIFNILWTYSVKLNGASVATVLVYSSVAFTALLGWRLLGESLSWRKMGAVTASLSGCLLVSGALGTPDLRAGFGGILVGILAGLSYAGYSLMGRSAARRGLNPWTTLFYTFVFATLVLLAINLYPAGLAPGAPVRPPLALSSEASSVPIELACRPSPALNNLFALGNAYSGWLVLFLLAAGPTVAGFGLYNVSLGHLPSSVANLIVSTEPVFTAAIAYSLLGERFTLSQVVGGLLVLTAVVVLRISEAGHSGEKYTPLSEDRRAPQRACGDEMAREVPGFVKECR